MKRYLPNVKSEHLLSAFFVFISVIFGRFFIMAPHESSLIWPALGFIFGFAFYYGMRVFYSLVIGSILGYMASYLLTGDATLVSMTIQAFLLGLFSVIPAYIGYSLNTLIGYQVNTKWINIAKFLLIASVIGLLASLSGHAILVLFGFRAFDELFLSMFIWWIGDVTSLIIIGVPLLFALHFDKHPLPIRFSVEEGLFYALFLLFAYLFFAELIPGIYFREHKYLFSLFAIAIAFRYPYRTAYMFSFLTYYFLVFYSPYDTGTNYFSLMIDINIFLIFLTLTVLLIKDYMYRVQKNNKAILETSKRLDKILDATHTLLDFSSAYHRVDAPRLNQQITKMFDTIFTLFDKADYGSCTLVGDHVHFVKTIGFDTDHLNALKYEAKHWQQNLKHPTIVYNTEQKIRLLLKRRYADYAKKQPPIKQSIHVGIRLNETSACEMSFDLAIDNPYDFTESDYTFFKSIQTLFTAYYESERFSKEFDTKKHEMVLSLLRTLELYEKDLKQHSLDVAYIAKTLAQKMKLTESQIDELYWAGIAHDIGKLGVEETIVRKESLFSVSDYEQMKTHPMNGFHVLNQSDVLTNVALYVRHHHERFDGLGYPDKLKGDDINLGSQIVAIAEAVASMAAAQPYAKALTSEEVIEALIREKNQQFSAQMVELTIESIQENDLKYLFNKEKKVN